jgi:hypothetical protein
MDLGPKGKFFLRNAEPLSQPNDFLTKERFRRGFSDTGSHARDVDRLNTIELQTKVFT